MVVSAYVLGLNCARVPWIRELAGIDAPVLRSAVSFESEIKQLTAAHTARMEALHKQAEVQENEATNLGHLDMYRAEYATSAARLRQQILDEEKGFGETIAAFRNLKSSDSKLPQ